MPTLREFPCSRFRTLLKFFPFLSDSEIPRVQIAQMVKLVQFLVRQFLQLADLRLSPHFFLFIGHGKRADRAW
jgi:hypothetical protein